MTKSSFSLTPEHWQRFTDLYWEQDEFFVNDGTISPPVSEQALFDIVVDMCSKQQKSLNDKGQRVNSARVFIGARMCSAREHKYLPLFPTRADGCFSNYSERVQTELNGQFFSLVIDELELSPELRHWSYTFLHGLYKPLKKFSTGHMWSLFFGNYQTTIYGVHDHNDQRTSESAFYFPITGNKKMRTWRPTYVAQNPELKYEHDYSAHLAASVLLEADPGGMIYWPSDRWHIGSSTGGDVSIVFGVTARRDLRDSFADALPDLLVYSRTAALKHIGRFWQRIYVTYYLPFQWFLNRSAPDTLCFEPDDLLKSADEIPPELRKVAKPFAFIFGDNLERALSAFWLSQLSTFGLTEDFEASENRLFPLVRVERNVGSRLVWRRVDNAAYLVASGQANIEVPQWFLPVVEHIHHLQPGEELVHTDLTKHLAERDEQKIEELLTKFMEFLRNSRVVSEIDVERRSEMSEEVAANSESL